MSQDRSIQSMAEIKAYGIAAGVVKERMEILEALKRKLHGLEGSQAYLKSDGLREAIKIIEDREEGK